MKKSQYGYLHLAEEVATALDPTDLADGRSEFVIQRENWRAFLFLADVGVVEIVPGDYFDKDYDTRVRLRDAYLHACLTDLAKAVASVVAAESGAIAVLRSIQCYNKARYALKHSDLEWTPQVLFEWVDDQIGLISSYAAVQADSLEKAMANVEEKKRDLEALQAKHAKERAQTFDPRPYIKPERLSDEDRSNMYVGH